MTEKSLLLLGSSYIALSIAGTAWFYYERTSYDMWHGMIGDMRLQNQVAQEGLGNEGHRFLQSLVDSHHKEEKEARLLEELKLYPLQVVQVHNEGDFLSLEVKGSVIEGLKYLSRVVEIYPLWDVQIKKVWTKDKQVYMIWNFP